MSLIVSEQKLILYDRLSKCINENTHGDINDVLLQKKELLYRNNFHKQQISELLHKKDLLIGEIELMKRLLEERNMTYEQNKTNIVQQYRSEFEKLRSDHESKVDTIKDLTNVIVELKLGKEDLNNTIVNLSLDKEELAKRIISEEDQVETERCKKFLLQKLHNFRKENKIYKNQLKEEQNRVKHQKQLSMEEIKNIKNENEDLRTSLQVKEMEVQEISSKQNEIIQSKSKLISKLNSQISDYEFKLKDKKKMVKFLFEKCEQIDEIVENGQSWKVKCSKVEKNYEHVNKKCKKLKEEKILLLKKMKENEKKLLKNDTTEELINKIENLTKENKHHSTNVESLKDDINGKVSALRYLEKENERLKKLLDQKTIDCNEMNAEMINIKSTKFASCSSVKDLNNDNLESKQSSFQKVVAQEEILDSNIVAEIHDEILSEHLDGSIDEGDVMSIEEEVASDLSKSYIENDKSIQESSVIERSVKEFAGYSDEEFEDSNDDITLSENIADNKDSKTSSFKEVGNQESEIETNAYFESSTDFTGVPSTQNFLTKSREFNILESDDEMNGEMCDESVEEISEKSNELTNGLQNDVSATEVVEAKQDSSARSVSTIKDDIKDDDISLNDSTTSEMQLKINKPKKSKKKEMKRLSAADIFGASPTEFDDEFALPKDLPKLGGAPSISSLSKDGKGSTTFLSEIPSLTAVSKSTIKKTGKSKPKKKAKKDRVSSKDLFGAPLIKSPSKGFQDDVNSVLDALF